MEAEGDVDGVAVAGGGMEAVGLGIGTIEAVGDGSADGSVVGEGIGVGVGGGKVASSALASCGGVADKIRGDITTEVPSRNRGDRIVSES
jgi:hypothetical protein